MCPPQVRAQLLELDGVSDAEVSFADKTVTVTVDEKVAPENVAAALTGQFAGSVHTP